MLLLVAFPSPIYLLVSLSSFPILFWIFSLGNFTDNFKLIALLIAQISIYLLLFYSLSGKLLNLLTYLKSKFGPRMVILSFITIILIGGFLPIYCVSAISDIKGSMSIFEIINDLVFN